MKISCDIIRDILPLYAENMVSQPTREMVDEHLSECDACAGELTVLKNQKIPIEPETTALEHVKKAIRRRRILSVLSVLFFVVTVLIGGVLLLDAPVYLTAEEAVKEVSIEGNTVKIVWDERVIGTGGRTQMQESGNYTVTAWSNLLRIIKPAERVPYDMLEEEVKLFISKEEYDLMDNTSTYSIGEGTDGMNFWYCNPPKGSMELILDNGNPYTDTVVIEEGYRIKAFVIGMSILCAICMAVGIMFRRKCFGLLIIRTGILAGCVALSTVIVTAGQLVDISDRFTEMLVDSTVVALPMVLCGLCVMQLILLNRQEKGL